MSLYNSIFGVNPASGVLLAMIGQTPATVGRFRDTYVIERNGEPVIAIYTRNGGGNRECWCADYPEAGYEACKHRAYQKEVDEVVTVTEEEAKSKGYQLLNVFVGGKRQAKTGRRVMETRYECLAPDSAECGCPGCIVTWRFPTMPGYLGDRDDEFDCTYNTAYFRAPDEWRDLLAGLARDGSPGTDWEQFIDALKEPPIKATTRPQRLAVSLIESMKAGSES